MIISVHTPKTAGTSFKAFLETTFGDKLLMDYDISLAGMSPQQEQKEITKISNTFNWIKRVQYKLKKIECIHGHFHPYKYRKFKKEKKVKFITWLRDPIERLISIYFYWKRFPKEGLYNPYKKKLLEENWDIEKFCFTINERYYLNFWNFPIENFDFIGITEFFEEDLVYFNNSILKNNPIENIPKFNYNPDKPNSYYSHLTNKAIDDLKILLKEDYQLYHYALKKRQERTDDKDIG